MQTRDKKREGFALISKSASKINSSEIKERNRRVK
jgi:hypothetical protein